MQSKDVPKFEDKILSLDFLVFSSHKTATQSITHSLNTKRNKARHCHDLRNINIKEGDFASYLEQYLERNNKKLQVISVFREPIERHISSFFQGYGTRPLRQKKVENESQTIIYKKSVSDLQKIFYNELSKKKLIGYRESIDIICDELKIDAKELAYNPKKQYGVYESELIKLYVFRFDLIINNFTKLLSKATGRRVKQKNANLSDVKWYKDIYSEFKSTLDMPKKVIVDVYRDKNDLINLFYNEGSAAKLDQMLTKYTKGS